MKRNIFFKALAVALLGAAAPEAGAQGIYVNKKSGESVAYPKAVLDRVVPTKITSTTTEYAAGVVTELKYEKAANMNTARMFHQIFPSGDGFVVVGGHTTGFELTQTAEIYQNGKWSNLKISSPHDGAFSVTLSDGRVMVGGGFSSGSGVGQSKKVDIYDPKKQTFAAGPDLSVARAFCRAIAIGKKVYVSGNWYADDPVLDYYDGKTFTGVADMDGRTRPYMFSDNKGNVYSLSTYGTMGKDFGTATLEDGTPALSGDRYDVAENKTYYYRFPLFVEWVPLDLPIDARMESCHYTVDKTNRYLMLTKQGNAYMLCEVCTDNQRTYTYTDFSIPTTKPGGTDAITYRGSVFINEAGTECYLIGFSGKATSQTVHIVSYDLAKGYWTIASAEGFKYNLMEGSWTLLKDGRLACAGGNIKDNTDAQKGVYLFTPPKAGAITTDDGTAYGVTVYKADGSSDTYSELELESITTYQEEFDKRITQEIPVEYLSKMSAHMPIYSGSTPPNIEGSFKLAPSYLLYNSNLTSSVKPGRLFYDYVSKYSGVDLKKNVATFQYEELQRGSSTVESKSEESAVKILGEGNNFTAFSVVTTKYADGFSKLATILSGTLNSNGITNYCYGILMLDKEDPNNTRMDVGEFRIFKDQDGFSESVSWLARQRDAATRSADGTLLPSPEGLVLTDPAAEPAPAPAESPMVMSVKK